ncbi:hypothetical protein C5688_20585 [Methylocystis sp. MitZ-2018]|nr:hypothetical protein C5688_20585 [Methylocystis sp. MitZ-2018]
MDLEGHDASFASNTLITSVRSKTSARLERRRRTTNAQHPYRRAGFEKTVSAFVIQISTLLGRGVNYRFPTFGRGPIETAAISVGENACAVSNSRVAAPIRRDRVDNASPIVSNLSASPSTAIV